ncbi:MAG TPA: glycoside hydrolase family 38 C-terminal domain-containing protein [Spirochaetia bacterium]|nr:glycoside hydrolase family 38 C-terminal domain-containing protein [Spirochaetia bacterium]HRZ63570.1 glycoside hydrolase family 38 C-terminal domain-containing protein [Spirochaetia bacterium]
MNDSETRGRAAIRHRRIRLFMDEIRLAILRDPRPFAASYAPSPDPVPLKASLGLERRPVAEGEVWGRNWESGYFKLEATVPLEWRGRAVAAWLDFGGEALVYSREGLPLYGLSNGSAFAEHYAKDLYRLFPACAGGERVELLVEAAASYMFGLRPATAPASKADPARHGSWEARLGKLRLCEIDEGLWGLWLDMDFLLRLFDDLEPSSVRASRILRALFEATTAYRGDPANAAACRAILAPELAKPACASALSTTAVGHAHIDTAWLWRIRETRRKIARTFANQLDLIERYPGYVFGASAPQHYQWVKEDHPELYERVKRAVSAGRWEPQGAMWVEADCNLVSGESMVRQILRGKNFWKDEFGLDVRNCWIPDVFGYAASMPQILRKSGVDSFLTQKLSWSKNNEFPHDTFIWRGIDGSEVLTHFPPEYTYNSYCQPEALRKAERAFHEKDRVDEFITLMGMGDGGGGPKEEHLEHALRARDAEGLPKVSLGRADELLDRLRKREGELETWVGELYLEYHRGTYTTQARTKRDNRRLEQELFAAESLCSCLPLADYPRDELGRVVDTLLLHQFHDIIPGSSVHAVYEDAAAAYAEAFGALREIESRAFRALGREEEGALTLFNPLGTPWAGLYSLPDALRDRDLADGAGGPVPVQASGSSALARVEVPAQGFLVLRVCDARAAGARACDGPRPGESEPVLENELARYRFDASGRLVEAFDKELGRGILKAGARGNVLSLYEDTPHNYDAWDIDFYYVDQLLEEARPRAGTSWRRSASGPLRQALRFELEIGGSSLAQEVSLDEGSKALSFSTEVDWRESRRMLRVAFPVASTALEAACEIPFGYVMRPTHANTEWDFAKFEVCAQRWVDLSDARGGFALLNDCKYGHRVRDAVLDLCLLRSPLYPDPDADFGPHEFAYVLYPHAGGPSSGEVQAAAARLNRPPLAFAGAVGLGGTPVRAQGEGFSVEALKKAERGEALVLRLVENRGLGAKALVSGGGAYGRLVETDLVEWAEGEARSLAAPAEIELKPFEIRTFKAFEGA